MHPLRRISAATALSLSLLVAGAGDVPAATTPATTVRVRPADLDRGAIDGDGVAITRAYAAPPGFGGAALAFTLDGAGPVGSDSMFGDVVDEASVNVTPRGSLPVRRLDRLSYWTYQPLSVAADAGLVPVLQVHLVPDRRHGPPALDGHLLLQFTPADNAVLQGRVRAQTWQRWNAVRRDRARWRVLESSLHASADADPNALSSTEEHPRCDRHDCTITWRDVREDFDGMVVAEVRLVLTPGGAVLPGSAGTAAGGTPSNAHGDHYTPAAFAEGLSLNRVTYDFAAVPRRARIMLAAVGSPGAGQ
jgi:hypothetical protein